MSLPSALALGLLGAVMSLVAGPLLATAGAPAALVTVVSVVGGITVLTGLAVLIAVMATRSLVAISVSAVALVGAVAAGLLLLVHEPLPPVEHPEWWWYWPVANTLYFGSLVLAGCAALSAAFRWLSSRERLPALAFALSLLALGALRIAPYR